MDDSLTLLDVAFEDLQASKLLLENNMNSQSLFYFQQAVEKSVKAIGLSQGFLVKEDLQRTVSHDVLKVYLEAIKFGKIPSSYQDLLGPGFDIDESFKNIKSEARSFSYEEVMPIYLDQIEHYKNANREIALPIEPLTSKKDLIVLLQELNIEPDYTQRLERTEIEEELVERQIKGLNELIRLLPQFVEKSMILYVLGFIVIDLVNEVRYPNVNDFMNPSLIYTNEHILVKNLDSLHEELYQCIKFLNMYIMKP